MLGNVCRGVVGAALAGVVLASTGSAVEPAGVTPPPPPGSSVAVRIGPKEITYDELKAQLSFLPPALLEQARSNDATAKNLAIGWYEEQLLAKAAYDDGFVKSRPGLEGAAQSLGNDLIAREYAARVVAVEKAPTDAEIETYYKMDSKPCVVSPRYHLAHAGVVLGKNAGEAEVAGATKRMQAMQDRLKSGVPFATVANEDSDLVSKGPGGDLGWHDDDKLGSEVGAGKIRALSVGAVTEPIRTEQAVELFLLVGKEDARTKSLAECREEIVATINAQYRKPSVRSRVDELVRRYGASMNIDAFLAALAAQQAGPTTPSGTGASASGPP